MESPDDDWKGAAFLAVLVFTALAVGVLILYRIN
jgi:hypothetical protein